ncbi:uncharacterized protein [Macrobrachium rosenbergii]|uniref:uncharacterized protein isoform X2 n=1 Tax=Macrobrachium rosenbergii TaxID=79674 RepID=UPI0034D5F584
MLKWTLRNSNDAPTPPLPDARYQVRRAEVKLNLKDSNKCWLETQVKVAQVRSTSKIAGTAKENEVLLDRENGKLFQEKENESIFRRLISPSHSYADDDKKRKRHHKHYRNSSCRCNPLDPLRLFSGEVTDSDTGSVYMRLEHTPVALQPRPQVVATTGPHDPRRKPLCDISNGDYSDLRKHLQCISSSSSSSHLHYHHHHLHHHHPHAQELPQYLQKFAAAPPHAHGHGRHFSGHFQRSIPPPPRPDPLGASDSQSNLNFDPRRRSRSSSRSRSRSSSAPRSLPLTAINSSLLEGSTLTTTSSHNSSSSARGVAEGKSQSMIQEGQCPPEGHSHCLKRHSIADIPSEASFRGVWQIQKERRGRSSSHERKKEKSYERVRSPRHLRDRRKDKEEAAKEESRGKTPRERVEGRRASREKVKEEPIYERVDNGDTSESSKTNSGSSLNSKNSYNSFDNAVYMSMKDLRERCTHDNPDDCSCQQEHLYSSLHLRISPDPNKTPVHMHDHLYENMLYLPMTEVKSVVKKPIDLNRPLPDPPNFEDAELDNTCDFTSEPQKDIHKPVAIKISNDLIARFGKSPNDRQHPMPQYGLYIATQPSKKPCKIEDCHQSDGRRSQTDKPGKVYKSTGQHVHINYSHEKHDGPSIPLHNLRPPPPPPPRKSRSSQGSSKTKTKSKGSTKPKLDPHLPVIYENTRQEEELVHSAKKRKLRHSMEIEFSFDDEDRHMSRSSEEASVSGSSPRGHNSSGSDNPDSGVSEGVNTPLVSPLSAPRSPQTPRSDSLLEEPCTPLTMDELHGCNKSPKENIDVNRNSNIYVNLSHDVTDPRFLSLLRDSGHLGQSIAEAYIDDLFHQMSQQVMQQTHSSMSTSNFESTCRSFDHLESPVPSKSVDLSKMLLSAVGRNLFSESTKVSTPDRETRTHSGDAPHNTSSLSRRHSFSSLADISRRLSKIEFHDDTTSLWGLEVSDHDPSSPSLKKTKSLHCLDLSVKSPVTGNVPLMDSMAEILKDPEEMSFSFPASKSQLLSHSKMSASPEESEQSGQWWLPGEGGGGGGGRGYWNEDGSEEEKGKGGTGQGRTGEVSPTEGSGKRAGGGQAAQPGSFSELPSSHDRHPVSSQPSITPASHCSPTSNPTLPLPVMSGGQQHLGMGRESASASSSSSSCYSVPLGPPSCEEENSSRLNLSQCASGCGGDSTVLTLDNSSQLTSRQQRRQEESSYRLQRMLQDRSRSPQETEQDESVSADWSMEAVLDEASTFEHHDLDAENSDLPESPESQESISLYALGSEFADSIYISPKLCEKIKEVSEEKMLARLRKSFRSKKEKAPPGSGPVVINGTSGSSKPKVGILMFVDNPMYLSPEVKKEAKVVSSQQQNSVWYVGNPMYNSPDPNKLRNLNYDAKQKAICEKENQRNARLAKVVCQNNNLRKPLGSLWLQSNPCYYSPDVKNHLSSNPNTKHSSSTINSNNNNNNNNNTNNPNPAPKTYVREKPDDHYLTPISVKHPKNFVPKPSAVPLDKLNDGDILDLQKFIDHEYCTIPGDESDSWVSQSTSRKSDSPVARRTLEFGATKKQREEKTAKKPITPSRIWRQTGKNQHSTPRKYQGTLEKNLDTGAALGTRAHRTPRAVKRGKKTRETAQCRGNSPTPPPLPARPHPGHHHYVNERTHPPHSRFEDTSDFHRQGTEDLDDSTKFQLPPDSVYESITFLQGKSEKKLPPEWVAQSRILDRAPPTGLSSCVGSSVYSSSSASSSSRNCSRKGGGDRVRRSASCVSSFPSGTKNGLGPGSLSEGSLKARSVKKCTTTRKVTKKYRARDVLQGKGQLKLAVYENYGLLTIHIIEAKKLRSRLSSVCNPYVKISLVPDTEERTFCRTPLVRATNAPHFDQKFSFDFLPEDLDKRLLVSVWSRDTLRKRSEFLGCMSFSIAHISTKRVHGWFRLLTETLGRRKHFAVSFLNASHDTTRSKMEEVLILDDHPSTTNNNDNEREPLYSTLEHHQGPPLPNHQPANDNELVGNSPQKPRGQTPYTITICISKGNQGYGFSVKWTKPPRVERVEPDLAADRAGLRAGDYIIFIGEHNVVKYDENAVLQIIRECGETLIMEVYRRGMTKVPRGLANGYANRASISESTASSESHPRKRLSHITFNSEAGEQDRQNIIYNLINCEQAFSNSCRFGLERYFIPLKFRTDLITQTQHSQLFSNMDQLVDMSDSVVDRLMGNDDDEGIGDNVGFIYYQMVDEMAENYSKYFSGLPEADKVLSHKLHEIDFKDFLLTPQIPRKKPDITTFIHKPAEHIRELVGFLTKLYSSSPGHKDNAYLDTVLDRLKACYRGMTSQQNIMEPTPPLSPTGVAGNALRPPLVSVSDIEQRLVFTKYTQPFRLHDNRRQWVFGGELYKFEGRNLKQYWVMLFTDLLLFTKINRDRVIFVMEDPVPLTAVLHAVFTVKKKATEFRLIIDTTVKVPGATNSYMTLPRTQRATRKKKNHHTVTLGRENKRTLVLRAPTLELKATWSNLIQRQLYVCQQMPSPPSLYGDSAPSLGRAVSTDGLHSPPAVGAGRFSCSVGDLRPGGETEEVVELNDVRPKPAQRLVFKSSKTVGRNRRERIEEIELDFEDVPETEEHLPSHQGRTAIPSSNGNPVTNHRHASTEGHDDLIINIQDEGRQSYSSNAARYGKSKSSKVKQKGGRSRKGGKRFARGGGGGGGGGGYAEEVVLKMSDEPPHPLSQGNNDPSQMSCALYNRSDSQESVPDIVVTQNVDTAAVNGNYPVDDDEDEDDFVIEDVRTGVQTYLDPKKKGIGSKVKDKLFPNRHLPKAKKIDRAKKVEQFVDSIMIEDLNRGGRVTPIFDREEYLTYDDYTQKRHTLLQNHPKNFIEGDTEIITLDFPTTSSLSPQSAEFAMEEERRQLVMKRKEDKKKGLTLEGIEEESPDHSSSVEKPIISPEAYEDYIGESVENDYPELAGGSDFQKDQYDDELFAQREQELYEEEQRRLQREQEEYELQLKEEELRQQQEEEERLQEMLKQQQEEELRLQEEQQQLQWQQQQQELEEQRPTGPLSGSASMSFMDDHSPTSNGNCDFYRQCIAKTSRDLPQPVPGNCSVDRNFGEFGFGGKDDSISSIKTNFVNSGAINNHTRTSCTVGNNYAGGDRKPKRTISLGSSASASGNESRNNSTSTSEHSSMSISTCSVSSNAMTVKKNRSCLFLPTSTTSLPEISIEPPTPQAPKPKDNFDRENKIKYDLRVPGYRSMFLTVPGFDDDDGDRYLPRYSCDSNDEESSSDDDVIHKPRVFASLAGMADSQRLKRYGSSCDIAQFGVYGESTSHYGRHNDFNANADSYNCKSKVGGTGSGAFVADKLAVFERVVEEEHRKFIECQEVRKRIFRQPKKSGEYLDKFYSPQVIENIDARASVRSRKLRYYDDVFDSDDNPRSPSPNRALSPPSRALSPPKSNAAASPSGYRVPEPPSFSPQPRSNVIYSNNSEPSEPPRSPSPLPTEDDYDYDVYGYLGNGPQSSSPGPAYGSNTTRQCSPEPQSQAAKEIYSTSSRVNSPGPSSALQVDRVSSLDKQTDEVMEMLDNSYLDMNDLDAVNGPTTCKSVSENNGRSSGYDALNKNAPSSSSVDPLDDVFEIEDYDNMGSTTSVGRGGHKRKAAPAPPPPNNASSSSSTSENKLGGFFNRVRKDKDKDKEGDRARMKKTKEKKEKKENKDKEKPAGKRFQLFGGAKKANEPSTAEGAEENSPKKDKKDDKGKRRLFGRGKENFLGRSPNVSHKSDQQAARMTSGSFDQDSIDLDDETEFL